MIKFRYSCITVLLIVVSASSLAGVGEMAADCDGCHGTDGVSEWSDMPTIAGISDFVLSDAMFFYRDGERPCAESEYRQGDTSRPATDMCAIAETMSDEQIEAIAAHYAELEFKPAVQDVDAALAASGKQLHDDNCENCHFDSGRDPEVDASILAGQWKGYLRAQFADYAAGERNQPGKMEANLSGLSDQDVEALINFYASLQ